MAFTPNEQKVLDQARKYDDQSIWCRDVSSKLFYFLIFLCAVLMILFPSIFDFGYMAFAILFTSSLQMFYERNTYIRVIAKLQQRMKELENAMDNKRGGL